VGPTEAWLQHGRKENGVKKYSLKKKRIPAQRVATGTLPIGNDEIMNTQAEGGGPAKISEVDVLRMSRPGRAFESFSEAIRGSGIDLVTV